MPQRLVYVVIILLLPAILAFDIAIRRNGIDGYNVPVTNKSLVTRRALRSALGVATAGGAESFVEDAITVTSRKDIPKIKVERFHQTWEWTHNDRKYSINYRVEGRSNNGQPLLLIHGFGANLNHFRYNIPSLVKEGYTVYAMDLLGFGGSEKPIHPETVGFSVELFSQQIVDFIASRQRGENMARQSWILAGNSIGGTS
jgi:hypothetical protein